MLRNRIVASHLTMVAESLLEENMKCCFLSLAFGTWGDILAGVRTLKNSLSKFKSNLFRVEDWRDFCISRINRKQPNISWVIGWERKQVSQARVPVPLCRAAHKTPQRMWVAGHTLWVMTALPKNVRPQQRMFWKPFKSLPGKPQPAIHHLSCVWVGCWFSLSSLAPLSSHQIPD